jgi:hypothetical protein
VEEGGGGGGGGGGGRKEEEEEEEEEDYICLAQSTSSTPMKDIPSNKDRLSLLKRDSILKA